MFTSWQVHSLTKGSGIHLLATNTHTTGHRIAISPCRIPSAERAVKTMMPFSIAVMRWVISKKARIRRTGRLQRCKDSNVAKVSLRSDALLNCSIRNPNRSPWWPRPRSPVAAMHLGRRVRLSLSAIPAIAIHPLHGALLCLPFGGREPAPGQKRVCHDCTRAAPHIFVFTRNYRIYRKPAAAIRAKTGVTGLGDGEY